jgi:hypothetical protein
MVHLRFLQVFALMLIAGVVPLTFVQRADAQMSPQIVPCPPGTPITLTGTGPARRAFLLSFGSRAVSGGSVNAAGRFRITLVVGRERAGDYPVMVRLRGVSDVLLTFTCTVPAVTSATVPTPILVSAPPPAEPAPQATSQPASPNADLNTHGADVYNCSDFASWDAANAVFQANLPGDANQLDGNDRDGIPCEDRPGAP